MSFNSMFRLNSRQFLWSFRLPGEAQKIDRMMECFAQRYCQLNPDIFTNADTCYVLSFAIIMLNTSLHNPSVKDKPTPEQFVAMNRGINNGGDLPQELLQVINPLAQKIIETMEKRLLDPLTIKITSTLSMSLLWTLSELKWTLWFIVFLGPY